MADYFDEMGWRPLAEGETPNHFLHLARLLRDFNMFEELNAHKLAPPAAKSAIQELKEIQITNLGIQCPVCLKEFDRGDCAKKLPCNHMYHTNCILPWLEKTNSCPLCRYEFPTDDEDYEAYRKEKVRAKEREEDLKVLHNSMFS